MSKTNTMTTNQPTLSGARSRISRLFRPEILLVALFATITVAAVMRPASNAAEPARLATVDLEKTFNSLNRYTAEQATVKAVGENLEKQVKAAESTVRELQSELDNFKDGSKEQADAIAKLQASVGELRAVQQFVSAKLEMEKARALRDTYLAIKDAVRRFAEKEGYDYILLDDSLPEMDPANAQKTMAQISARRFLYSSPKRDVTAQLLGMMNNEWKEKLGG
jgi:Skp family chaperone for outer membrane proteins